MSACPFCRFWRKSNLFSSPQGEECLSAGVQGHRGRPEDVHGVAVHHVQGDLLALSVDAVILRGVHARHLNTHIQLYIYQVDIYLGKSQFVLLYFFSSVNSIEITASTAETRHVLTCIQLPCLGEGYFVRVCVCARRVVVIYSAKRHPNVSSPPHQVQYA